MTATDAIKTLHTSMIDTRHAYEKAAHETDDNGLKMFFESMIALRETEHNSLHRVLIDMGETAKDDGSFMTSVHRMAIGVRSAVTGINRASLSAFESGEESILSEYDEAIRQDDLQPATRQLLQRQRLKLVDKIAEMKSMRS